jgi:hypothetical protein
LLGAIAVVPSPEARSWCIMRSRVGLRRPAVEDFVAFVRAGASVPIPAS